MLLHGNGAPSPKTIGQMIDQTRALDGYHGQPIVFNEDDHYEFDQPENDMLAAIRGGASWGYFDFRRKGEAIENGFQSVPVDWKIDSARKRAYFDLLQKITGG